MNRERGRGQDRAEGGRRRSLYCVGDLQGGSPSPSASGPPTLLRRTTVNEEEPQAAAGQGGGWRKGGVWWSHPMSRMEPDDCAAANPQRSERNSGVRDKAKATERRANNKFNQPPPAFTLDNGWTGGTEMVWVAAVRPANQITSSDDHPPPPPRRGAFQGVGSRFVALLDTRDRGGWMCEILRMRSGRRPRGKETDGPLSLASSSC